MVTISQLVLGRNKGNDNFNFRLFDQGKNAWEKIEAWVRKKLSRKIKRS